MPWSISLSLLGAGRVPQGSVKEPVAIPTGKHPASASLGAGGSGACSCQRLAQGQLHAGDKARGSNGAMEGCLLLPVTDPPGLRSTGHQLKSRVLLLAQSDRDGLRRRNPDPALPLVLKHFVSFWSSAPTGFCIERN